MLALGSLAPTSLAIDPTLKYDVPLSELLPTLDDEDSVDVVVTVTGNPQTAATGAYWGIGSLTYSYVYKHALNGYAATLDAGEMADLAGRSEVVKIYYDRIVEATMDVSRRAVQADLANNLGWTGDGVTVAVLDTGISSLHSDLSGAIVGCVQFLGGQKLPVCEDDNGHGTHVSGTIAGRGNTYRGVAPDAKLVAVKVLNAAGLGLTSDIIAGMDWIVKNKNAVNPPIRVMSASLGSEPSCEDANGNSADSLAADAVMDGGVVAVIAAGNAGPGSCTIGTPGDARKVITIGATDDRGTVALGDDALAGFSSRGPTGDGRVKPDVSAPGTSITSTYLFGQYSSLSGTSMATPHVSGLVALLLEKEPSLTPAGVKTRLTSTAFKLAADTGPTPNNEFGHGFVRACAALQISC